MDKYKSKQIYIKKLDYPFDTVKQIINNEEIINQIFNNKDIKIKKFIGSNWLIKESGFIFYFSNDLSANYLLIEMKKNDFECSIKFKITHINGDELKNELYYVICITKNTVENITIYENFLEYFSEKSLEEFEKYFKNDLAKKIVKKIISNFFSIINNDDKINKINITKNLLINHSFIIKKNYKDVFNFFYDFNNIVKCLKADKTWKVIIKENDKKYKDSYIIINENVKVHYHVISINEVKGEKIEIIFNKTNNSSELLNNIIKLNFIHIEKNLCFFLYETYVPANISASNYKNISYYAYYCIKTAKKYIESDN